MKINRRFSRSSLPLTAVFISVAAALYGIPVAAQTPDVAGGASDNASTLDAIMVTGIRRSIQSAQAIKRDSVQMVDSIVSHDLDKLPDLTAAVALARVPGIQVTRQAGEANTVLLRGLPDLISTYNGREIFSQASRGFSFQDFGSPGVAGLDVYKSGTADLIEGGIAGSINIRARRPLDFAGTQVSGSYHQILADQADKYGYNATMLFSTRWHTNVGEMGILINASKHRIRYLDSTRDQGTWMLYKQSENQPDLPAFFLPDGANVRFDEGDRIRPTYNASFQWRPNEQWEIVADALFIGYRNPSSGRHLHIPFHDDDTRFSDVVTEPGLGGLRAISATVTGGLRPEGSQQGRNDRTDHYQFGFGATYHNDAWRWSIDLAGGDSRYRGITSTVDHAYTSIPVRDVRFDIQEGSHRSSSVSLRDFDPLDPNNYVFRGLQQNNLRTTGRDLQLRSDLEFIPEAGVISAIQTGVRTVRRKADLRRHSYYEYTEPQGIPLASLPIDFINSERGFDGDRNAPFPLRRWWTPNPKSIRRNIDQLRALVGRFDENDLTPEFPQYAGDEDTHAAYGQLRYEFTPGILIDGALGMRVVRTQTDMSGLYDDNQGIREWRTRRNAYTDYLPNASMRLRFSDALQLRLAATRTRSRAGFGQLNATTTLAQPSGICASDPRDEDCIMYSNSGNPELDPLRSTNYDLSLEYYFSETGSASVALFRRNVTGFIFDATSDRPDPEGIYNLVRHSQPENAGKGKLQGVEVTFASFLHWDRLPEWMQGFGIQANYTYIDHCTELNPYLAESMPGCVRISGVAKNAYNLVLIYERPVFSARMAYNWQAKQTWYNRAFDPILRETGPTLPEESDGYDTLDFSMRYSPKQSKLSFSFDVSNLLRRPQRRINQYNLAGDTYPFRVIVQERLWSVGMQFRF